MKYCSHCANELLDEAILCPKCGCPVDGSVLAQSKKEETKAEEPTAPKADWFDIYSVSIFGVLILCVFIGVMVGIFTNLMASYWIFTILPLMCSIAYLLGAAFAKETKHRIVKLIGGSSAIVLTLIAFIMWVVAIA